jgi:hypothetical protein
LVQDFKDQKLHFNLRVFKREIALVKYNEGRSSGFRHAGLIWLDKPFEHLCGIGFARRWTLFL